MSYHHQPSNKNTKHLSAPFISKPVTPKHFSTSDVFKNQDNSKMPGGGGHYYHHHENPAAAAATSKSMTKPQVYMSGILTLYIKDNCSFYICWVLLMSAIYRTLLNTFTLFFLSRCLTFCLDVCFCFLFYLF